MVKLTQIDETEAAQYQEKADNIYSGSESDSESEVEDDFDINETFYERVVALKDIVPPKQRTQILDAAETAKLTLTSALSLSGGFLWTVTSSILLLGVPLSLAILSETQLQEMEREMSLQESAQNVLTANAPEEKK